MNKTPQISLTTFFTFTSWITVVIVTSLLFMTTVSAATFPFTENFKDQNLFNRGWKWKFEEHSDWRVHANGLEIKSSKDSTQG